ncbi:MAG: hypothetical protein AAF432_01185 [Planctomycetota bacterium]
MLSRNLNHKLACTGIAALSASVLASGYQYDFQHLHGTTATFHVTGPATGSSPDVQGDAMLTRVEYPNSDEFITFYKPTAVHDFQWSGNKSKIRVRAGSNTTDGLSGDYILGADDGNSSNVTSADVTAFEGHILTAMSSNNLNQYMDISGNSNKVSFIVEFDRVVKDDDPGADDFGELLYFERGSGSGNSWLKIQAVDASGTPLGPWLVITPSETVQTTPTTTVYKSNQTMGTTSIDVSRLGVSEFQFLKVSNTLEGELAYTGGGDMSPDFKLMAVMTNTSQLAEDLYFD